MCPSYNSTRSPALHFSALYHTINTNSSGGPPSSARTCKPDISALFRVPARLATGLPTQSYLDGVPTVPNDFTGTKESGGTIQPALNRDPHCTVDIMIQASPSACGSLEIPGVSKVENRGAGGRGGRWGAKNS